MSLPDLTADGRLPPGRHVAALDEVEAIFVDRAPCRLHRALIWRAALLHMNMMCARVGACSAWIDGGFVTQKAEEPHDIDIVYVAPTAAIEHAASTDFAGLLHLVTLKDLIIGEPSAGWLDRLQPVGGLVDAFLVPEVPERLDYWDQTWSRVKGPDGLLVADAEKGYVEVRLQ